MDQPDSRLNTIYSRNETPPGPRSVPRPGERTRPGLSAHSFKFPLLQFPFHGTYRRVPSLRASIIRRSIDRGTASLSPLPPSPSLCVCLAIDRSIGLSVKPKASTTLVTSISLSRLSPTRVRVSALRSPPCVFVSVCTYCIVPRSVDRFLPCRSCSPYPCYREIPRTDRL